MVYTGSGAMQGIGIASNNMIQASQRFAEQIGTDAIKEQNGFMDDGFDATAEMTTLFMQSTKLMKKGNVDKIINAYLTFAHTSNLVARNVDDGFKRSIIASLKVADKTGICTLMQYDEANEELQKIEHRKENV